MGLFDFFVGAEYDPTYDRLSAPLGEEASNLALHVERCAGRYQQLRKAQHNTARRISVHTLLLVAVLVVLVLANGEKALKVFMGIL